MFKDEYTLFLDTEDRPRAGWYIDSRAMSHMIGDQITIHEFSSQASGIVKCGVHSSMMKFHGKQAVSLKLELGRIFRILEVLYVPCMKIKFL